MTQEVDAAIRRRKYSTLCVPRPPSGHAGQEAFPGAPTLSRRLCRFHFHFECEQGAVNVPTVAVSSPITPIPRDLAGRGISRACATLGMGTLHYLRVFAARTMTSGSRRTPWRRLHNAHSGM